MGVTSLERHIANLLCHPEIENWSVELTAQLVGDPTFRAIIDLAWRTR